MPTSVWISLRLEATGVRISLILTHQSPPRRMRLNGEMFERFGLTAQCVGCRAVRTVIGYLANHTERCRERIEQELEKEPEGAFKVARDRERTEQARGASQRHDNRGP